MSDGQVARVYAEALFQAASEADTVARTGADLREFVDAVTGSSELANVVFNPQIDPAAKRRVVAGLMSDADAYTVADAYSALDREAKALGSTLSAPFMTLSFMALLVIPHLKLSDRGLFDVDTFSFT